jgi:Fuc2NAc and GlcNAc transferase
LEQNGENFYLMANNLWIYMAALGAGALGALIVAVYGKTWALLDRPNERSSHERPVPRGGGIGILAAFVICSQAVSVSVGFWAPAALLAMVSFAEDRFTVGVAKRLAAQLVLTLAFLFSAAEIHFHGLHGAALLAFYLLYIAGTANFYNFMDGINGIAGITGMVGFALLGAYGISNGKDPAMVVLCFSLAWACIGFLPFNLPRARVFLGDVGSILLGFVFACVVVIWAGTVAEFLVLAGFLFLFYADELVTLAERLGDGESPVRAHRRHLYQVLANEGGVAHWRVSTTYGAVQLLIGLAVWMAAGAGLLPSAGLLTIFLIIFIRLNNRIKKSYRNVEG